VPEAPVTFARAADMCYAGQGHPIRVELAGPETSPIDVADMTERFRRQYRGLYGYTYDDLEIQMVTLRVTATAARGGPIPFSARRLRREVPGGGLAGSPAGRVARGDEAGTDASAALKGERPAYSPGTAAFVPHRVYAVDGLAAGATVVGPAILEEEASTLVIGEGASATAGDAAILVTLR
jgi:N-methylhydantoinase A